MNPSILMFCPQFRPLIGGAERQAEKLARALAAKGVRVTILTPALVPDTPPTEEGDGIILHRFPLLDLTRKFPWLRGVGLLNLALIRMQVEREVARRLDGVDVVHAHIASPLTAFAARAARRYGVPVLCKVAMAGQRNDLNETVDIGWGGRGLALSMVRDLDCWVATTRAVADSLYAWGVPQSRVVCIPNGVELRRIPKRATGQASGARRFLYLGRLSTNIRRDVPTVLGAFDRLADRFPDAELAVVGDGDLRAETASLVAACRHADRIRLPGLQEPASWLEWADCFVLPSVREGLSNALLEAMSQGLACIANDIPPNREVLDDGACGELVPVGDEERWLQAMLRVAQDRDYFAAMGQSARLRAASQYGIDSVADRYLALYARLRKRASK